MNHPVLARLAPWSIALLLTLLCAPLLLNGPLDRQTVRVGSDDRAVSRGMYDPEIGADGAPFRWTRPDVELRLQPQSLGWQRLTIELSAPLRAAPAPLTIERGGRPIATFAVEAAPRRYTLLLGPDGQREQRIALRIAPLAPPGETRALGVALTAVTIAGLNPAWQLPPAQLAALFAATLLLGLALRACGAGWLGALAQALFALISATMRHSDPRFAQRWDALLLTATLAAVFAVAWLLARRPAAPAAPAEEPNAPVATGKRLARIECGSLAVRRGFVLRAPFNRSALSHWPRSLWLALLFIAATALLFAPVWPMLGSAIVAPAGGGDAYEYLWKLRWFADALVQQRRSPAFAPQIYFPVGFDLALSEMTPANTLPGVPLTLLFGAPAAYNLLLAASYALTGLFAALLAARLGAGALGAIVCGLAVAFCQYRFLHTLTQLPLAGTQWMLLALYGVERFVATRQTRDLALAALGAALSAWSSWYYGPTFLALLGLYGLLRLPPRDLLGVVRSWRGPLAAALVLLAMLAPYAQPYVQARQTTRSTHPIESLRQLSARPADYLQPSEFHILWGVDGTFGMHRPYRDTERMLTLGPALLLLGLAGLARLLARRESRRLGVALAICGLVAFVFSLGPDIVIGGRRWDLPARFVYDHVPVLDSIRVWARAAFYLQIMLAMAAGLALRGWGTWRRGWRIAGALLALAVTVELANWPLAVLSVQPRPVDRWLASQPETGAFWPLPEPHTGLQEYATIGSRRPLIAGYGTFLPTDFAQDGARLGFPDARAAQTMRRLGGRFVVIEKRRMDALRPAWRAEAARLPGVTLGYEDAEYAVYVIEAIAPP